MKKIICQRLTLDISHFQFHCLTKKLPFARNQLAGINNNRSVAVFDELLTTVVESLNAIVAIWLQRYCTYWKQGGHISDLYGGGFLYG